MSHAKETPRQKMIGMMYLVLTCLLALNVSKEVLNGFVTINENIETTNSNFTNNTKLTLKAFKEAESSGHPEVKPYYQKAIKVTELTQKTYDYIDILKQQVQLYTEAKVGADTMKLKNVDRLDDYDKPTYFLLGDGDTEAKTGQFSANELKTKMNGLAKDLNDLITSMESKEGLKLPEQDAKILRERIKLFTPNDNNFDKEGKKMNWEFKNFYHMPLAATITNLSKIQSDIRNIEAEMVNTLAAASGKLAIKFNSFQARIVPVSNYVQSGINFTADVFLSATSTEFKPDNMEFILGDMDTATGKLAPGAIVLPMEQGNGKISLPSSVAGNKTVHGWIKFKNGLGKYEYYEYKNEYVVANSAVAVSADKMNVLYVGVDNPISISAAGVAPTNLVVTGKGCGITLTNSGNGNYLAKVTGAGEAEIFVAERTANGTKTQGAPKKFRVKKFPTPPMRILGKSVFGTLEVTSNEAKTLGSIGVDLSGFDFNVPFKVSKFTISIFQNGKMAGSSTVNGNNLNGILSSEISKLKKGDRIYIEDIFVQAPDGIRAMPMVKIVVK